MKLKYSFMLLALAGVMSANAGLSKPRSPSRVA